MRILVTGSRDWTDWTTLQEALYSRLLDCSKHEEFVVVHGHCPSGADRMADNWAAGAQLVHDNVYAERHPADWERACTGFCFHAPRFKNGKPYCPVAGHLRNQAMVDLGADVCLAFPLKDSRGTKDCMKRAEKADIPVINLGVK